MTVANALDRVRVFDLLGSDTGKCYIELDLALPLCKITG